MKSRLFRPVRAAGVSAAVAHALAWVAFLWIVVGSCVYHCAFFFDRNGLWFFTAMFFPVILTGLALITLYDLEGTSAWNHTGIRGPGDRPFGLLRNGLSFLWHHVLAGSPGADNRRHYFWCPDGCRERAKTRRVTLYPWANTFGGGGLPNLKSDTQVCPCRCWFRRGLLGCTSWVGA